MQHHIWMITIPLICGFLVCIGFVFYDKTRLSVRGVSPSYFASVALLFGLFASIMASDSWQRTAKTNAALSSEVSGLRALMRISEVVAPDSHDVSRITQDYVRDIMAHELQPVQAHEPPIKPSKPLHEMYKIAANEQFFGHNPAVNAAFFNILESVRAARWQRLTLRKSSLPDEDFGILILLGVITQIAIGLSHTGNQRAINATVMLFSLAFTASVYFIMDFNTLYGDKTMVNTSVLMDVQ